MDENFQPLSSGEVLSISNSSQIIFEHSTFRAGEFLKKLQQLFLEHQIDRLDPESIAWLTEQGVDCEVLRFGSDKWVKGRVRLHLEFCEDQQATSPSYKAMDAANTFPVKPAHEKAPAKNHAKRLNSRPNATLEMSSESFVLESLSNHEKTEKQAPEAFHSQFADNNIYSDPSAQPSSNPQSQRQSDSSKKSVENPKNQHNFARSANVQDFGKLDDLAHADVGLAEEFIRNLKAETNQERKLQSKNQYLQDNVPKNDSPKEIDLKSKNISSDYISYETQLRWVKKTAPNNLPSPNCDTNDLELNRLGKSDSNKPQKKSPRFERNFKKTIIAEEDLAPFKNVTHYKRSNPS